MGFPGPQGSKKASWAMCGLSRKDSTGHSWGDGTEGEGNPCVGKCRAVHGKGRSWCDLLVYDQHLSAEDEPEAPALKNLRSGRGFRPHSWFTNCFKDLKPFFQVR